MGVKVCIITGLADRLDEVAYQLQKPRIHFRSPGFHFSALNGRESSSNSDVAKDPLVGKLREAQAGDSWPLICRP